MKFFLLVVLLFSTPVFAQTQVPPGTTSTVNPTPTPVAESTPVATTPAIALPKPVTNIEFILDASGSMEAKLGNESQMTIAKRSIKDAITSIPPGTSVALRVYAHRVPKADQAASCQDTELVIPFQPLDPSVFLSAVEPIQPKGYTPIAYSLRAAANDFLGKESQHVVILLSDGEETCGGDPIAEAKSLLAQGFKINIHTIGFRVDEKTRAQLTAISQATNGVYYDATDAASLSQNLIKATQKALLIEKPAEEVTAKEIRGGHQYSDAVPLQPGIEYRLDHHQRPNEYDYFYIETKRGQALTTTIATTNHGISINGDKTEENNRPNAGIRVDDASFQKIRDIDLHGEHQKDSFKVVPETDSRYYILVGTSYDMHRNSPFKVELQDYFDANLNQDAGQDPSTASSISIGEYRNNWITARTDEDTYQILAKAQNSYSMVLTPKDMEGAFEVEVFDADRVRLLNKASPNAGAVLRLEGIVPQRDGALYLVVRSNTFTSPHPILPYSFSIQEVAAATPRAAVEPQGPAQTDVAAHVAKAKTATQQTLKASLTKILIIGGAGILLVVAVLIWVLVIVFKKNPTPPKTQ